MKLKEFSNTPNLWKKLKKQLPKGAQKSISEDLNLSLPYVNKVINGKTEGMRFETVMRVLECALSYAKRSQSINFEREVKRKEEMHKILDQIEKL